jgi:hypothetical protein
MCRPCPSLAFALLVMACVSCVSCASTAADPAGLDDAAFVTFGLGSPRLAGASVRITARRVSSVDGTTPAPADARYRCRSGLTTDNCFPLDPSARTSVRSLCSSEDLPGGVWNFDFQLHQGSSCQGLLLNPDTAYAARCFDSGDLYSRAHPNASVGRPIHRGMNELAVACLLSPWQLAYVQRPTTTVAGDVVTPAVTVQVQDVFGEPLPASGLTVTLSVFVGPGTFAASSTTTAVTNDAGLATFPNLVLDTPGTYTLRATSGALSPIDINSFQVTPSPVGDLVYAATGTASTRTSTGTMTVAYPTATVTNDLLLLVVVNAANLASTPSTGWTLLADVPATSPKAFRLTVWWRLANGESTVALTTQTTTDGASAWAVRYRRPSGYPPLPSTATANVRTGTSNPGVSFTPTPDLTTSQPGAVVLSIVAAREANPLSLLTTQGFNRVTSTTSTPGQGVALGVANRQVPLSGSTTLSPTWSRSGSAGQWAFATAAFR